MIPLIESIIGLLLGALGAAIHLLVTHRRAIMVTSERRRVAPLLAYPLGLLGPAVAVIAASRVDPLAALAVPIGVLTLRSLVLRKVAAR